MTLVEKILKEIGEMSFRYKGMKVNAFGVPKIKNHSFGSVRTTFSRIHKKGLIEKNNHSWQITKLGKKYMERKADSLLHFNSSLSKNLPKNLIVMFDIPETRKAERDWFRWHLKKFNYVMIQKSVWVGPSPLPKKFTDYIKKIKLKNTIKTFKLARSYKF